MESMIIGYKISSSVLKEPSLLNDSLELELWLVVDKDFVTDDKLPHFFLSEIPFLKDKTADQLRTIYRVKKEFAGSRITK